MRGAKNSQGLEPRTRQNLGPRPERHAADVTCSGNGDTSRRETEGRLRCAMPTSPVGGRRLPLCLWEMRSEEGGKQL